MGVTCPRCGREAERREQFCGACGAFLGWDEGQPADSQPIPKPEPQKEEQRAEVQIRLESDLIKVAPGSAESTAFVVKNLGTKVEEFRFLVNGPEWVIAEPATVSVYPGQEATGAVQAAPPRTPDCAAGVAPFQLTVTSALHSHLSGSAAGRVDVAPYYEFAAQLDPSSSRGRGWTRHAITLNNRGNTPLRVLLDSADVADGLRLSLSAVTEVEPGAVTEVPVAVHGRRRWFGRPESRTFAVVAEPPKPLAPVRLAGTRVLVPIFPRWVPVAAAVVLAAVAAAAIVHAATGKKARPQASHGGSSATGGPTSTDTSPPTNSPKPTPTLTPTLTPVPVAPVAGQPISQAKETLKGQGFVPVVQAFYDPSTQPGNVVNTKPPPGTPLTPGSTVTVQVRTGPTELAPLASSAQWTATNFVLGTAGLTFDQPTAKDGSALSVGPSVTLEDGSTNLSASLETIPPDVMNFAIRGAFKLPQPIIAGQVFNALVGFRQGTGGKIGYEIHIINKTGDHIVGEGIHEAGTDQLEKVQVDLSNYAGKKNIALRVEAIDSPGQDDVVWVDPRIEEWNAPSPQGATQSPTPTVTPS